ncbi:MAG: UvrD-helicase domain-containing protein [Phycisphaerae bacterium]|nr:UvrD-helicase domain-containing protein [Phycisphaerae bacterium]MDD5381381.1 UvrD-helicase domain-containing protein [Phycisphaerae bacterium]
MHNELLQQLTPSQRKAVFHVEGPLLVIAGPGSGKTRVITYRIAALIESGVLPHNICAITFTNKAAEEMRQRAISLGASGGAYISTFHSLCVRILRKYADKAQINPNFSIYDDADQTKCIKQAIKDCELDTANFPPSRTLENISKLKNRLIDVDIFKTEADDFLHNTLGKIYARYQSILSENNALDFDDLLMKTAFLLRDCPDVCSELGNRFKFLLIDEYQDTNHAQYNIAKSLVSAHNNICVTGDPDQSIYRWRGADIRNILAFENDWPDAAVVKLEENFRSKPEILEIADKLIAQNQNRKQKTLIPTKPPSADVAINAFGDELEEVEAVANHVRQLSDKGTSLNDIAVFYRVNAQSRLLEEAFIRNKIPYQIVRGVEFYGRKEIRDILAYLKILVNPDDEVALLRIINTPARGIGKTTIDKIHNYADRNNITFFEALRKTGHIDSLSEAAKTKITAFTNMLEGLKKDITGKVAPLIERIFTESGLEKSLRQAGTDGQDAIDNANELLNAAARYDQQAEAPSLLDYLQQIALFSDTDAYDASKGCVAFMTLHCAKGLEFENVFIVGVEEGLLPHERSNAGDEDELEEERRLFFVGITRAKSGLYISCAQYRKIRGQQLRTIPSQFLFEIGADLTSQPQETHYCYDDTDDTGQTYTSFAAGQLVRHKLFGSGTVKEFVDMGENSVIVIKFHTGQIKSLMLKYADLEKLNNI